MADTVQVGKICDVCQTIFSGTSEVFPGGNNEYFHHRSSQDLRQAVESGCHLCNVLQDFLPKHLHRLEWIYQASPDDEALRRSNWPPAKDSIPPQNIVLSEAAAYYALTSDRHRDRAVRYYDFADRCRLGKLLPGERRPKEQGFLGEERSSIVYHMNSHRLVLSFWLLTSTGRAGAGAWPIEFLLLKEDIFSTPLLPGGTHATPHSIADYRFTSLSTSDEGCCSLARRWLTDCVENHASTCQPCGTDFVPSRLVYLHHDRTSLKCTVRLSCTAGNTTPSPKYMTLSHCWGDPSTMFKLTSTNMDRLLQGIDLEEIPTHFQEALEFSASCGVKYLWIDSMCIIQDDRGDWESEAPLMGKIYHNAVCNLSVATQSDSGRYMFVNRKTWLVAPLIVSLDVASWSRPIESAEKKRFICVLKSLWKHNVEDAHVNQRGWVFQERILSRRKIFFAQSQLFWECRQRQACETIPNGLPERAIQDVTRDDRIDRLFLATIDNTLQGSRNHRYMLDRDRKVDILRHWTEFLHRFTKNGLTYRDDRLMAISGIAETLERVMDDETIFGLWEKELPYQLVYQLGSMHKSKDSVAEYNRFDFNIRVPSWSWAQHDAELRLGPFWVRSHDDAVTFVSVEELKYGIDAKIVLPGNEELCFGYYLRLVGFLYRCEVDPDNCSPNWDHYQGFRIMVQINSKLVRAIARFDSRICSHLFVLPVFKFQHSDSTLQAILVTEALRPGSGIYQRCGYLGVNTEVASAVETSLQNGAESQRFYLI